jgi:NTE family protein
MLEAVLDASMNALDKLELKQFANRTIPIPTGAVPTLKFDLSDAEKEYLYKSGLDAAKAFFAASPDGENTFRAVPAALAR